MTRSRDLLDAACSESDWETFVLDVAKVHGWELRYHTHDSRRSQGGFPDWVLIHPRWQRCVVAELKTMTGRFRPGQREWLAGWQTVADVSAGAVEVYLWRPCDADQVEEVLSRPHRRVAA